MDGINTPHIMYRVHDCVPPILTVNNNLPHNIYRTYSYNWFVLISPTLYPIELEIKDTTDTDRSASYLDLHLEIDSEGRLRTKVYDKRDDFNFPIVNFPFICSNIPAAPAHGVYISQMIRYSRFVVPIRISLTEGCC